MHLDLPKLIITRPKPENYILENPLQKAVEVALTFNQPLLLTGEPGTGKTLLAYKIADLLHNKTKNNPINAPFFSNTPLRFNTKTTSTARDLLYNYDAIGHFQSANVKQKKKQTKAKSIKNFITLQALGKAIALANPQKNYAEKFIWRMPERPQSSVVLIDEIDKAPRDFTNDILNEIEDWEFSIKENNHFKVKKGKDNSQRILVIMTSNSEKNLPDAFLRRCLFYHIDFPKPEKLQEILKAQLTINDSAIIQQNLKTISEIFSKIREVAVRKKPATAELVAFVKLLEMDNLLDSASPQYYQWFRDNIALLAKSKEDIIAIQQFLEAQR